MVGYGPDGDGSLFCEGPCSRHLHLDLRLPKPLLTCYDPAGLWYCGTTLARAWSVSVDYIKLRTKHLTTLTVYKRLCYAPVSAPARKISTIYKSLTYVQSGQFCSRNCLDSQTGKSTHLTHK